MAWFKGAQRSLRQKASVAIVRTIHEVLENKHFKDAISVVCQDATGRLAITSTSRNPEDVQIPENQSNQTFVIVCSSLPTAERFLATRGGGFEAFRDSSIEEGLKNLGFIAQGVYLRSVEPDTRGESPDSLQKSDIFSVEETSSGTSEIGPPIGKNSSVVTVFTIWSAMMGTSILTMPWALSQSGFLLGIVMLVAFGALMGYLAYRVMQSGKELAAATLHPQPYRLDFSKVCEHYLGLPGKVLCFFASILSLLGALVVYYVLICNFAFNIGSFINDLANGKSTPEVIKQCSLGHDVACAINDGSSKPNSTGSETNSGLFNVIWSSDRAVPGWLLLVVFPLISIRSPTFFTKFTALGTVAVMYILVVTIIKAGLWGVNVDFSNVASSHYIPLASANFPCITGVSSLAYFIHNALESIMSCNKNQDKNPRDLFIGFSLVALSYLAVGVIFLLTFPGSIDCMADNLLNNLLASDVFAFVGRITLFFQIITVFPLLMFILREQVMLLGFKKAYPSFWKVSAFHVVVLFVCLMFAMFLPSIGTIIRFSGSFSALIYIFTLPCLVYIMSLMRDPPHHDGDINETIENWQDLYKRRPTIRLSNLNRKTWLLVVVHLVIIAIGLANFIAQIAISVGQ